MPELPEVETVRRGLAPIMVGRLVDRVEQRRPDLRFPFPDHFAARLTGQTVTALDRRSKYLLARLSSGETLLMHLGMSGRFLIESPQFDPDRAPERGADIEMIGAFVHDTGATVRPKPTQPPPLRPPQPLTDEPAAVIRPHDHVVFHLSGGHRVIYNDPRRFGLMDLIADGDDERHRLLSTLGPEPLSAAFDVPYLSRTARGRSCDLKAFLLDQRVVAGLGNIYVSEALFRARLSPLRRAGTLASPRKRDAVAALVEAIRDVLEEAIAAGGSTLRDYRQTDGELGYFQHAFQVYGRADDACTTPGCAARIKRVVQAGRSTFHCASCQR